MRLSIKNVIMQFGRFGSMAKTEFFLGRGIRERFLAKGRALIATEAPSGREREAL